MSRLFSGTSFDKPKPCEVCGLAPALCRCIKLPPKQKMSGGGAKGAEYVLDHTNADPPKDQMAKVRVEKRKGNREVTVVTGLEHAANNLPGLLTELKGALATGGSVQGRVLELQGDQGDRVVEILAKKGYKAKAF